MIERDSKILGRKHLIRVYLPPGYHQNPLRRFPVLYMQDGKNLFFPDEAFLGREWKVDEALHLLDETNSMDRVAVVGIHSGDRMLDYTKPGYEAYARSVVEEVKPEVDRRIRVSRLAPGDRRHRLLAGRRRLVLHGVGVPRGLRLRGLHVEHVLVSRRPDRPRAHGAEVARRSSTSTAAGRGDNYEVTLAMAMALGERGYRRGRTSSTSSSRSRSTTRRPGGGGCTSPSSSASAS